MSQGFYAACGGVFNGVQIVVAVNAPDVVYGFVIYIFYDRGGDSMGVSVRCAMNHFSYGLSVEGRR